jgi:hypothetical protein
MRSSPTCWTPCSCTSPATAARPCRSRASSDVAGQGKARQGKARQGKARQGKARQGKARQGKARQGKARQGRAAQVCCELFSHGLGCLLGPMACVGRLHNLCIVMPCPAHLPAQLMPELEAALYEHHALLVSEGIAKPLPPPPAPENLASVACV